MGKASAENLDINISALLGASSWAEEKTAAQSKAVGGANELVSV
jgi:hypothetical protein